VEDFVVGSAHRRLAPGLILCARHEHASRCMVLVDPGAVWRRSWTNRRGGEWGEQGGSLLPLLSTDAVTAVCRDDRVNPFCGCEPVTGGSPLLM